MPKAGYRISDPPPVPVAVGPAVFDAVKVNACAIHRHAMGWSRRDLAAEIGTSAQVIWLWESGRSIPSPAYLPKLADALKVDALQLLAWLKSFDPTK
jgi:DNA-binding XRE family transcriptional regulator